MKIIDLHCDTITLIKEKEAKLLTNMYHIDLKKLEKGNYLLQNFAVFTNLEKVFDKKQYVEECIAYYKKEIELNSNLIQPVLKYEDLLKDPNKIKSMLTLEEGDIIDSIGELKYFYDLGVRMIAPLWNYKNRIGMPAVLDQTTGLTHFGKEYIQEMERLNMIIDVSHMNDQGIKDVLNYTTKPIVASHSNSRTITNSPRNLPDELIKQIHQRRGVIGINYYGNFLGGSTIENIIKHIDYIVSISSIDVVALGSDFDGIDGYLEIQDCSYITLLVKGLFNHGYCIEDVKKICFKNVLRVYKEVLI